LAPDPPTEGSRDARRWSAKGWAARL